MEVIQGSILSKDETKTLTLSTRTMRSLLSVPGEYITEEIKGNLEFGTTRKVNKVTVGACTGLALAGSLFILVVA